MTLPFALLTPAPPPPPNRQWVPQQTTTFGNVGNTSEAPTPSSRQLAVYRRLVRMKGGQRLCVGYALDGCTAEGRVTSWVWVRPHDVPLRQQFSARTDPSVPLRDASSALGDKKVCNILDPSLRQQFWPPPAASGRNTSYIRQPPAEVWSTSGTLRQGKHHSPRSTTRSSGRAAGHAWRLSPLTKIGVEL